MQYRSWLLLFSCLYEYYFLDAFAIKTMNSCQNHWMLRELTEFQCRPSWLCSESSLVSHTDGQCPLTQLQNTCAHSSGCCEMCACLSGWEAGITLRSIFSVSPQHHAGPSVESRKDVIKAKAFFFCIFCAFESLNPWWENHFTTCQFFKCNTSRKIVRLRSTHVTIRPLRFPTESCGKNINPCFFLCCFRKSSAGGESS